MKQLTLDKYLALRLGSESALQMAFNSITRSFTAPTFSAFWRYWNPGYGFFLLKYCYQPLRKVFPHSVSIILTFCACGFSHDVLILIPSIMMAGDAFMFPLITCWFLIMAILILIAEFFHINFKSAHPMIRVTIHFGFLATTFGLARFFDLMF